jgi:hypothetical protein
MNRSRTIASALVVFLFWLACTTGSAGQVPATNKVYGEWLIRPHPHQGDKYRELIETQGLPLFRKAGGRMVGWWNTLVGNQYEHVTIWEYDDMAAYERVVGFLGQDERFAKFVAARDPLLAGEDSRFLRLARFAESPPLPDASRFVIHEIHRVPLQRQAEYLKFMETEGLLLLKKHGFRPVGPWLVAVGKWSDVTYLFRFDSLAERDRLIAEFAAHPDGQTYGRVLELVDEITTRLLLPTPFTAARPAPSQPQSSLLPFLEQLAPGVYAAGFADRHGSANCGWVTTSNDVLLVDVPRGVAAGDFLGEVARLSGKPARRLVLTRFEPEDAPLIESLLEHGVAQVYASRETRNNVLTAAKQLTADRVQEISTKTAIGDGSVSIDLMPWDGVVDRGAAVVNMPGHGVLFAGPLVVNGPRTKLPGTDTGRWVEALRDLEQLAATEVVPGSGSWGGAGKILARQRLFLTEMRRQVGYVIAQGRPPEALASEVRISDELLVWMPYDRPSAEDFEHVYGELTVPAAPFNGRVPEKSDPRPHALVLISDLYHEPGHIEEGLRPVFQATGVAPHFTVDVRSLSVENLAHVPLLVILRDGMQHPETGPDSEYVWMTREQEQAVVEFVEGGGAFLNLHNSMGLYPDDGPYLRLVGGRYIGHGPLERFRVEVVDAEHPITRGVESFFAADEQHTPPFDEQKVHLLLRNRSADGKTVAAAGWCYEPVRGRLCHLASGHTREALLHPTYQRLLRNAVNWLLRREATK